MRELAQERFDILDQSDKCLHSTIHGLSSLLIAFFVAPAQDKPGLHHVSLQALLLYVQSEGLLVSPNLLGLGSQRWHCQVGWT